MNGADLPHVEDDENLHFIIHKKSGFNALAAYVSNQT